MDAHVKQVVREMSKASDEERITFPEVVKALTEVKIERYHADLVSGGRPIILPMAISRTWRSTSTPARRDVLG